MKWEPIANLANAMDALQDFHKKNPNKPKSRSLKQMEIPINKFPTHLFQKMPEALTEPIPFNLPTETLAHCIAFHGTHA